MDISDQLQLHGQLHLESLKFISEHRDQLNLSDDAIEHIIWFYYSKQEWTDELLLKICEDYKKQPMTALESLIISKLKDDRITTKQFDTIESVFSGKEIKRQLYFLKLRRKLSIEEELSKNEIEKALELRGYTYLEEAFEKSLISDSYINLFPAPKPGENDRKQKENLYKR